MFVKLPIVTNVATNCVKEEIVNTDYIVKISTAEDRCWLYIHDERVLVAATIKEVEQFLGNCQCK